MIYTVYYIPFISFSWKKHVANLGLARVAHLQVRFCVSINEPSPHAP